MKTSVVNNSKALFTSSTEAFQPINVFEITRQYSKEELYRPYIATASECVLDWHSPRHLFTARDALQPIYVFNEIVNQQSAKYQEYVVPFLFSSYSRRLEK